MTSITCSWPDYRQPGTRSEDMSGDPHTTRLLEAALSAAERRRHCDPGFADLLQAVKALAPNRSRRLRGDLLRQNQDGLERDGGERAGQQGRQTVSRRRCAAAADRRGRPDQGAQRAGGRIGDRLLARTARRSAKSRGRRAHPSDGARRSQRVRIRLALSCPAPNNCRLQDPGGYGC